jgi:endonuclease G
MPTLGPSLLFAAGLTLGVAGGYWGGRDKKVVPPYQAGTPLPPPPEGGHELQRLPLPTSSGPVVVAGGYPGM